MKIVNWFKEYISNFNTDDLKEIIVGIWIFIIFILLSSTVSYAITKLLKRKNKMKKSQITKNRIFKVLRKYIKFLGLYVSIIFLKDTLSISNEILIVINKIFKIITIFTFATFISECVTLDTLKRLKGKDEDDEMSTFIVKIIRGIIYIIAIFIAIIELGYDINGLVTGLGISSVVITLAAQNLAKDILGGIVIFTDKPFKVGDWIQFEEYEGIVEDITYRSTRIRTFDNSQVNIPNSTIANEALINWSRIEKRRYKIDLGLKMETPLNKVKTVQEKIKTMLAEKEKIMDDSIIVKFDKITDSSINILIYAYTDAVDYASFLSEKEDINYKIMRILESENVELAYDTKTIYVKK